MAPVAPQMTCYLMSCDQQQPRLKIQGKLSLFPTKCEGPDNPRSGIALQATTINGISVAVGDFVDPWERRHNVRVDGSYDNSVPNPYGAQTAGALVSIPFHRALLGGHVVGSNARNERDNVYRNPTTGTQSDDVISWQ